MLAAGGGGGRSESLGTSALFCLALPYAALPSVLLVALYSWHRLRLCSVGTRRSLVPFASPPPHLQLTLLAYHHKFEKSHLPIALTLLNLKIWHDGMILLEVQIDSCRPRGSRSTSQGLELVHCRNSPPGQRGPFRTSKTTLYPCSTKTREVLGNPSPTPKRFPETREIS